MSLFNGEWWIDDNGYVTYADGDIGDAGHQLLAWQSAIGLDEDQVSKIEDDYRGAIEVDGFNHEKLGQAWLDEHDIDLKFDAFYDLDYNEQVDLMKANGVNSEYLKNTDLFSVDQVPMLQYLEDVGANMKFVLWCLDGGCDARDFALEEMGWIRVKGDNFQVWKLDDGALERIKNFDEWDNLDEDVDLESSDEAVGIEEMSEKWYEEVPVNVLFTVKTAAALKRAMDPKGVAKWHRKGEEENPKRRKR